MAILLDEPETKQVCKGLWYIISNRAKHRRFFPENLEQICFIWIVALYMIEHFSHIASDLQTPVL